MVACTPHPGLGAVSVENGAIVRRVDLATCTTTSRHARRFVVPTLALSTKRVAGTESILFRGRPIYTHRRRDGPIELFGTSPDGKWALFAVDPQGSASLAADGLTLQAVSTRGGRPRIVASGLLYPDYRAWCGGRLVLTAGGDRYAAHHKWLIATGPPDWRPRILVRDPTRAFGSLACDDGSVVVQSARSGFDMSPRWSLWRVGLDGRTRVLDTPPSGFSDDSPRVSRGGRVVFVRSHVGVGTLWAHGVGPLAAVGRDDGYYGHRPWAAVSWSLQR